MKKRRSDMQDDRSIPVAVQRVRSKLKNYIIRKPGKTGRRPTQKRGADRRRRPRPVFPGLLRALRAHRSIPSPLCNQGIGTNSGVGTGGLLSLFRWSGESCRILRTLTARCVLLRSVRSTPIGNYTLIIRTFLFSPLS
jgi:hypothetical protein